MSRLKPEARKEEILIAAVDVALRVGFSQFTRDAVAEQACVSMGLVNRYFSNMPKLKKAVMRRAIKTELLPIIAQGLVIKDATVIKNASEELKNKAKLSI